MEALKNLISSQAAQRAAAAVLFDAEHDLARAQEEKAAAQAAIPALIEKEEKAAELAQTLQAEADNALNEYSKVDSEYWELQTAGWIAEDAMWVLNDAYNNVSESETEVSRAQERLLLARQVRDSREVIRRAVAALTFEGLMNAAADDELYKDLIAYADKLRETQAAYEEADLELEEKTEAAQEAEEVSRDARKAVKKAASELAKSIAEYEALLRIHYNPDPVWEEGTVLVGANGLYKWFTAIEIDGKVVDPSNYSSYAGSTYVRLHSDFLASLAAGRHTLTFVYDYGSVGTSLTILIPEDKAAAAAGNKGSRDAGGTYGSRSAAAGSAAKAGGRSANTGDPGAAVPAMGMLASLTGLLSILKRRKKEEA